jgi:CysZ protein
MIIAIQAYAQAHEFIKKHKLWKWILIPGILYTLLFLLGMYFFSHTSGNFIEWMALKTGLKNWLDRLNNGFLGFIFPFSNIFFSSWAHPFSLISAKRPKPS